MLSRWLLVCVALLCVTWTAAPQETAAPPPRGDLLDTFYWRGVSAFELGDDAAAIRDLQYVVEREPKYDYSRLPP